MDDRKQGGNAPDIRELLHHLPSAEQPPIHIAVEANGPLTAQQLTAAIIRGMHEPGKEGEPLSPKMKVKTLRPPGAMPGHALTMEREEETAALAPSGFDGESIVHSQSATPAEGKRIAHHGKGAEPESSDQPQVTIVVDTSDYGTNRKVDKLDRDPFEQLKFANKLIEYQGDILEICWDMREKLEQARDYIGGVPAWLALIDQCIALTADLQKSADHLRDIGDFERKHANYLIQEMEQYTK